jgi:uncharacterized Zn-finger protein
MFPEDLDLLVSDKSKNSLAPYTPPKTPAPIVENDDTRLLEGKDCFDVFNSDSFPSFFNAQNYEGLSSFDLESISPSIRQEKPNDLFINQTPTVNSQRRQSMVIPLACNNTMDGFRCANEFDMCNTVNQRSNVQNQLTFHPINGNGMLHPLSAHQYNIDNRQPIKKLANPADQFSSSFRVDQIARPSVCSFAFPMEAQKSSAYPQQPVEWTYFTETKNYSSNNVLFHCEHPGCSKTFDRIHNLKSHFKTHTGDRPFVCSTCGTGFSRNHDLKRYIFASNDSHERIHSGVRPYVCSSCNKSFLRLDALNRHLKVNVIFSYLIQGGRGCRGARRKDHLSEDSVDNHHLF